MHEINQGTVIYGMRSDKYPETRCYGIIISARCDIANCKVQRLYYIIAVDAKEWFLTNEGFNRAYASAINRKKHDLYNTVKALELNISDLLTFSVEEAHTVLNDVATKPSRDIIIRKYDDYITHAFPPPNKRLQIIQESPKTIKNFLSDVNSGKHLHFYYLPQNAYCDNSEKSKGLIVDLQEIHSISVKDAEAIRDGKIDFLSLNETEMLRYNEYFWLKTKDDFVDIEGLVISPWCEHLLQRFSNGFIRIGVEGPTEEDFEILSKSF